VRMLRPPSAVMRNVGPCRDAQAARSARIFSASGGSRTAWDFSDPGAQRTWGPSDRS
jgi:hypothetical protein